jgi:hypothetical protein
MRPHDSPVPSTDIRFEAVAVVSRSLSTLYWYLMLVGIHRPIGETGDRIHPSDLSVFRTTHQFQLPCCLCSCSLPDPTCVEAAVYVDGACQLRGQYVIGCATDRCGYLGADCSYLFARFMLNYDVSLYQQPFPSEVPSSWAVSC